MNKEKILREPLFILENFHPLALFVACCLLILMIDKTMASIPFLQKLTFLILAGPLYFIDIAFESWRLAAKHENKKRRKPKTKQFLVMIACSQLFYIFDICIALLWF